MLLNMISGFLCTQEITLPFIGQSYPPIADMVAQNPVFAAGVRTALWPVIWLTGILVAYPGLVALALVLALGMAFAPKRTTRRARN